MSINASLIKELRDKTGAGMLDCKKALSENNSNIDDSIAWLRKKGLSSAGKKAGRETGEGVIAINIDNNNATIIELNSETDFVGKNDKFLSLASKVAKSAHEYENNNTQEFLEAGVYESTPINTLIAENISIIGENITLKKIDKISTPKGKLIPYLHNQLAENIGKIGVIVALQGDVNEEVEKFGKQLAMHIAASKPLGLSVDDIDKNIVEKEKEILKDQALQSGKPEAVVEKMIEGRIRKFLEEIVLLEQAFIIDGKTKIKTAIEELKLKTKCDFKISGYLRYEVGS